jgi:hypothetical protein
LLQQNTCGQLFTTDFGYAKFTPMHTQSEAGWLGVVHRIEKAKK